MIDGEKTLMLQNSAFQDSEIENSEIENLENSENENLELCSNVFGSIIINGLTVLTILLMLPLVIVAFIMFFAIFILVNVFTLFIPTCIVGYLVYDDYKTSKKKLSNSKTSEIV